MAKDSGGASGGLKRAPVTKPRTPGLPPDERKASGGRISGATIGPPPKPVTTRPGYVPGQTRTTSPWAPSVPGVRAPVAPRVTPPQLTWSPLLGLRYGNQPARIGTYGPEVSSGGQWQQMADFLNARADANARRAEALLGGEYPEDTSWREYLADPTKPEEAAPSLVEQSRIMGEISRALNALDTGGADGGGEDYLFDDSGYGWGDGWDGGGGGGYSPYGPDSMLYQWRIGL